MLQMSLLVHSVVQSFHILNWSEEKNDEKLIVIFSLAKLYVVRCCDILIFI